MGPVVGDADYRVIVVVNYNVVAAFDAVVVVAAAAAAPHTPLSRLGYPYPWPSGDSESRSPGHRQYPQPTM